MPACLPACLCIFVLDRNACNNGLYRAEDVVRILYGYACGDGYTKSDGSKKRECSAQAGMDVGTCKYGAKARNYLLDVYRDTSKGNTVDFNRFGRWLRSAMAQALFLQTVCLPPDPKFCRFPNDAIFEEKLTNSIKAYVEVRENLEWVNTCSCPCKIVKLNSIEGVTEATLDPPLTIQSVEWNGDRQAFPGNIPLNKGSSMTFERQSDFEWLALWSWDKLDDVNGWFRNTCEEYEESFTYEPLTVLSNPSPKLIFEFSPNPDGCPMDVSTTGIARNYITRYEVPWTLTTSFFL